jgi:hypothetical protein
MYESAYESAYESPYDLLHIRFAVRYESVPILNWTRFNFPGNIISPFLFELGRQARPGWQTGIRLYRPVLAEGQNKSWGHRLTAKAITYQQRYLNNKYASLYA